jgi:hypothetical protein
VTVAQIAQKAATRPLPVRTRLERAVRARARAGMVTA